MNGQTEYEYKIVETRGDEAHFNLLGLSGWKLVLIEPLGEFLPRFYFIRERVSAKRESDPKL